MATVYLARDIKHDRLVALKVLHPELATRRSGVDVFAPEDLPLKDVAAARSASSADA